MHLLFDIGGTNMRFAIANDEGIVGDPIILPTPKDFEVGMRTIRRVAGELGHGERFESTGGGIAGTLDRNREQMLYSPHLMGWSGHPLRATLSELLECPVYIENDTAIVGLGEAVSGAGKDQHIVAYITVSTGVGGARIVNKCIDVSAFGFEPGHQIIDAGGGLKKFDEPAFPGSDLEAYISGSSVTERFHKKPFEITDDAFWDRFARLLAYGLNNTIVHWSPDIVVIGGSMMKKIGIPIERVRAHLGGILHVYPELPLIEKATLGDYGGIHGALAFVRQKHNMVK